MICHIVLFNPKEGLDDAARRSFALGIQDALRSIPGIGRAVVGRSIHINPGYQRSLGDKTYEFTAVLEFQDQQALLGYLQHPKHHALGKRFWESCDSTVVVEVDGADALAADIVELLAKRPNLD